MEYTSKPAFLLIFKEIALLITITEKNSILTGIICLRVPIGKLQWMFDFNVHETEHKIKYLPGFIAAAFLKSNDETQLLEYVQWASQEHFQAACENPLFYEHVPIVRAIAEEDVDLYEVYYTAHSAAFPVQDANVTISLDQELTTIVTHFKTVPHQQHALLDVLIQDHEREIRPLPGFVSVSFHQGHSGESVVEYLQFSRRDAYNVAQAHTIRSAQRTAYNQCVLSDQHVYFVGAIVEAPPLL